MQAKQNEEFICYFSLAGRCLVSSRKAGLNKLNGFLGRHTPSLQTSLAFIAKHGGILYAISLWPIWVTCPGCVPSKILVHPQPPCSQGSIRSRKILVSISSAMQRLISLVYYHHYCHLKYKTQHRLSLFKES